MIYKSSYGTPLAVATYQNRQSISNNFPHPQTPFSLQNDLFCFNTSNVKNVGAAAGPRFGNKQAQIEALAEELNTPLAAHLTEDERKAKVSNFCYRLFDICTTAKDLKAFAGLAGAQVAEAKSGTPLRAYLNDNHHDALFQYPEILIPGIPNSSEARQSPSGIPSVLKNAKRDGILLLVVKEKLKSDKPKDMNSLRHETAHLVQNKMGLHTLSAEGWAVREDAMPFYVGLRNMLKQSSNRTPQQVTLIENAKNEMRQRLPLTMPTSAIGKFILKQASREAEVHELLKAYIEERDVDDEDDTMYLLNQAATEKYHLMRRMSRLF